MTRTAAGSPPIDLHAAAHRVGVANDDRNALGAKIGVAQQRLRRNLRADAGHVAERERQNWLGVHALYPFDTAHERILGAETAGLREHGHSVGFSTLDDADEERPRSGCRQCGCRTHRAA